MSADIKWETVEQGDLGAGDKVRLTHRNGDVIHGIYRDGSNLNGWAYVETMGGHLRMSSLGGHSFERAVPERTLPTEPGLYALAPESLPTSRVIRLRAGKWEHFGPSYASDDFESVLDYAAEFGIVRLVPVTEVEELRKRLERADDFMVVQHRETKLADVRPMLASIMRGEA